MNCLGIPVVFDPTLKAISQARGIGPWKKIVVGDQFAFFTERERQAILLHEVGHCKLKHLEKRLLNLWQVYRPRRFIEYLRDQEYQADYFVFQCGYGMDLASAFARLGSLPQKLWYPDFNSRIARLLACSKG